MAKKLRFGWSIIVEYPVNNDMNITLPFCQKVGKNDDKVYIQDKKLVKAVEDKIELILKDIKKNEKRLKKRNN